MAGDPVLTPLLLGLGVTELSAAPGAVPQIKYLIRRLKMTEARELADFALNCESATEILARQQPVARDLRKKYEGAKAKLVGLSDEKLKRPFNVGFSGGEKKRNEVLQMMMLEPAFCVLDETDSGLDIDALKIVADGVNALRAPDRSFLVITHYQRLLDYIKPDVVHVLAQGKIQKTGGPELALQLEKNGYADFIKGEAA